MTQRRVLVVSMRGALSVPAYSAWHEFEDLILDWEDADLLELPYNFQSSAFRIPRMGYQSLRRVGLSERSALAMMWSRMPQAPRSGTYDLIVLTVSGFFDLFAAHRLRSMLAPGGSLVGVAIETWPSEVDQSVTDIEPVGLFDNLYVSLPSGADRLKERVGDHVNLLLPGGNVLGDVTWTEYGRRPVAVVNPGRRSGMQHARIVASCDADHRPYIFDTLAGVSVSNQSEHRSSYNRLLRHADVLICNYAKFDRLDVIQDARDVPGRFFEGIAAGNLLVGEKPDTRILDRCDLTDVRWSEFGLDGEGLDFGAMLADTDALEADKRWNRGIAASKHDWIHRWVQILQDLDLEVSPRAQKRMGELNQLVFELKRG